MEILEIALCILAFLLVANQIRRKLLHIIPRGEIIYLLVVGALINKKKENFIMLDSLSCNLD